MPSVAPFLEDLPPWEMVCIYVLVAFILAIAVRSGLRRRFNRAHGRERGPATHQTLTQTIPHSAGVTAFLVAVGLGLRSLPVPTNLDVLTKHVLPIVLAVGGVAVAMRVALRVIHTYTEGYPQLVSTARVITWIVGCAIIAVLISDALGVSLAPALTALGVGSLSVALALQDTLSNFFSGVYLLVGRQIRPGDFVRIDGGYEGYVAEIGWRATHLRTLAPSIVIVPNTTMAKAVITNFGHSNPRLLLATAIDVAVVEDPSRAEAALVEVAKGATDITGVEAKPAPFVRLSLDDRGLAFTVYVTVSEAADGGLVQQELRKRALDRLRHVDGPKFPS